VTKLCEILARPRLLFDPEWIARFHKQLLSNEPLLESWRRWLEPADSLLEAELVDEEYADGEHSQHGRYGVPGQQIIQMGMTLGTAYQVTGDRRYAEKLKGALLYYSGYRKWHGKGLADKDPAWHSELNTTRFSCGFAVGYDCIYDLFSEQERQTVREALIRLGIEPLMKDWVLHDSRIHAMDSMGHNWWSVCVAHAGFAALALFGDDERVPGCLDDLIKAVPEYFFYEGSALGNKSANFDAKGAFYESVNYAQYGLYEYLLFRLAYTRVTGKQILFDKPVLEQIGAYFLHTFYPSDTGSLTVNFGDSHIHKSSSNAVKVLLANGFEDPRLRWYLTQFSEPLSVYDFLFYDRIWDGESRAPSQAETSVLYDKIGWAVMRSGWEPNATLLGVKSGFTWNHAHADAGSFLLFHQGKPLLIDSGTCSYGRPEYHSYYMQSRAHNVVLFNGKGQEEDDLFRGAKESGQVYHLIDDSGIRYVYSDATGPMSRYLKRNFRHLLWLEDCIFIYDDLLAYEEGTFQWLLHYEGAAEILANGEIEVTNGEAKVLVRSLLPAHTELTVQTGLADHDPDREVPYYSIDTKIPSKEAKYITAVVPVLSSFDADKPDISLIEDDDCIGASIRYRGKRTDIYYNQRADGGVMHRNSIKTLQGWETDAYMVAVTSDADSDADNLDAIERIFICYGSFLRRNGVTLYASHSKATLVYSWQGEVMLVSLSGQPQGTAELRPLRKTAMVRSNGAEAVEAAFTKGGNVAVNYTSMLTSRRPG
jgi:hypothetical protein